MKPLMNKARDRNTINTNKYQFYCCKLSTSKGIKTQNDVVTKETVKANGKKSVTSISAIMATFFIGYKII